MSEQGMIQSFRDIRTMAEKLEAKRENWIPHNPELDHPRSVDGLVLDRQERELGFGQKGNAPIVRVLSDDGTEWNVAGFHAILRSELVREGPRIGDRIGVAYQGLGTAKENQSPPHLYRVVLERNPDGPQQPDRELPPAPDFDPDGDIPF